MASSYDITDSAPIHRTRSRTRTPLSDSKTSTKPSFFGKAVEAVRIIAILAGGLVFFPVVSILNAVSEYRQSRNADSRSIKASVLKAVQGFLIPIPIIGGIVLLTGQIAHRVKLGSYLADKKAIPMFAVVALALPFFGAAFIIHGLSNHDSVPVSQIADIIHND